MTLTLEGVTKCYENDNEQQCEAQEIVNFECFLICTEVSRSRMGKFVLHQVGLEPTQEGGLWYKYKKGERNLKFFFKKFVILLKKL